MTGLDTFVVILLGSIFVALFVLKPSRLMAPLSFAFLRGLAPLPRYYQARRSINPHTIQPPSSKTGVWRANWPRITPPSKPPPAPPYVKDRALELRQWNQIPYDRQNATLFMPDGKVETVPFQFEHGSWYPVSRTAWRALCKADKIVMDDGTILKDR